MKLNYKAKAGSVPIEVRVKPISRDKILEYLTTNKDERNHWCTQGKPCGKFNARPCCPPNLKTFDELKVRKNVYLVFVKLVIADCIAEYPKLGNNPYYGVTFSHRMTRNVSNRICKQFHGQGFRVGGCGGCQWDKTQVCKKFMPPLEGTGIDVVKLCEDQFGEVMDWYTLGKDGHRMSKMIAIGAIYTDKSI
jgi:predicted metal-binding protein